MGKKIKHVAEINPSTITKNHDAADINKDSGKLVGESDNLKEVAKPSSKCENTPVSNNNSKDDVHQKQVSHVPRVSVPPLSVFLLKIGVSFLNLH